MESLSFNAVLARLDSELHDRPDGPDSAVDIPNQVYFVIAQLWLLCLGSADESRERFVPRCALAHRSARVSLPPTKRGSGSSKRNAPAFRTVPVI